MARCSPCADNADNEQIRGLQEDQEPGDDIHPLNDHAFRTISEKAWEHFYADGDNLLFGFHRSNVNISSLHPGQIHILKLWQIYLDNVNPLLKVTHSTSLQAQIIDAAGDMTHIDPALEALMFGIYSISILTLDEAKCRSLFGSPKQDLLASYQFGCQQALLNCGFLRSNRRDTLTAFYLFLVGQLP